MGIPNYLIRDSLVGIVSQRLIRLLCNNCKESVGKIKFKNQIIETYKNKGCPHCNNTGYKGRGLVLAIHHINREMKRKLIDSTEIDNILTNDEMIDNLDKFIKEGQITVKDYIDFLEMEEIAVIDEEKFYEESKL